MNAIWRPVTGFPAYEINAQGRVRSVATHYVLTPRRGFVALSRDGQAHRCAVRDLAAEAWPKEPGAPAASKVSDVEPLSRAGRAGLLDLAGEYDCLAEECSGLAREKKEIQGDLAEAQTANTRLETRAHRMKAAFRETVGKLLGQIAELKRRDAQSIEELAERRGIMARLDTDNANLREQIAELKTRPATQPAAVVLSADEKDAEIARLRGVVAEMEAELAVYRVSAGL